jgi:hypothetical protein
MKRCVADAGYKTPAIAKLLLDDGVDPVFPYKRPMTKDGFFKKYEYVYDEYNDCYICPNNQVLYYSTTNRDGYREYKSCGKVCESCPYLEQCTASKNHVKLVTRHVWEGANENEGRAYLCCHEFGKTSNDKNRMGITACISG